MVGSSSRLQPSAVRCAGCSTHLPVVLPALFEVHAVAALRRLVDGMIRRVEACSSMLLHGLSDFKDLEVVAPSCDEVPDDLTGRCRGLLKTARGEPRAQGVGDARRRGDLLVDGM